jgi:hypothetical protein
LLAKPILFLTFLRITKKLKKLKSNIKNPKSVSVTEFKLARIRVRSDSLLTDSSIKHISRDDNENISMIILLTAAQICQPSSLSADIIDANYSRILSRPCFVIVITIPVEMPVIINSLKSDLASECDHISTKFCKRAILFLSDVISRLINQCISSGS